MSGPSGMQTATFDGEPAGPRIYATSRRMAERDLAGRLARHHDGRMRARIRAAPPDPRNWHPDTTAETPKLMSGLHAPGALTGFGMTDKTTANIIFAHAAPVGRAITGCMPAAASGVRAPVAAVGSLRPQGSCP